MERGCRNCMWLYHMVTYNPTAPCSECLDYSKWKTTKQTNADKIRAMTDEELAKFMAVNTDCYYCRAKDNERCASLATTPCGDIWLDWLREEVE